MQKVRNILRHWMPMAVVATGLAGLVYLAVQQSLRHYANDPQVQMAHDAADALSQGQPVASVLPVARIDIARSLAPFVIVYADDGRVLGASGTLQGEVPRPPPGVIEYTRDHGEERVTWQPEGRVRIAAVVVRYSGKESGFVLAGRPLREIEGRVKQIGTLTGIALAATLLTSLGAVVFGELVLAKS